MRVQTHFMVYMLSDHCNLRCSGCATYSPFLDEHYPKFEIFKKDLDNIGKYFDIEEFRFLGGEPLLNPDLIDFLKEAKSKYFIKKISVSTNGIALSTMPNEFYDLIDHIQISMYPNTNIKYQKIKNFLKTKLKDYKFTFYFKNTQNNFIDFTSHVKLSEEIAEENYLRCESPWVWKDYSFRDGYFYKCSIVQIKNKYFKKMKIPVDWDFLKEDGIKLENMKLLDLLTYLNSRDPLKACRYCHGTTGRMIKTYQLTNV